MHPKKESEYCVSGVPLCCPCNPTHPYLTYVTLTQSQRTPVVPICTFNPVSTKTHTNTETHWHTQKPPSIHTHIHTHTYTNTHTHTQKHTTENQKKRKNTKCRAVNTWKIIFPWNISFHFREIRCPEVDTPLFVGFSAICQWNWNVFGPKCRQSWLQNSGCDCWLPTTSISWEKCLWSKCFQKVTFAFFQIFQKVSRLKFFHDAFFCDLWMELECFWTEMSAVEISQQWMSLTSSNNFYIIRKVHLKEMPEKKNVKVRGRISLNAQRLQKYGNEKNGLNCS